MIYVRRSDDLSRLPMKKKTIARLRALGVNTIGQMFDDPHGIRNAEAWSDRIIEDGSGYALLEWGAVLPARSGALYWALEDRMLTVYGSGTMIDYTDENQPPWAEFREEIHHVTISIGVTNIGGRAFENCRALTVVELSPDAGWIGTGAFRNCTGLEKIICDQKLVHCREEPFFSPDAPVIFVGRKAFDGTSFPKERFGDFYIAHNILMEYFGEGGDVAVPEGVEEISPFVFENVPICSVKLPKSLKRIGLCAFQGTRLRELTLPHKLEQVDAWAFHKAAELDDVTLLNRRVQIHPTAFAETPVAGYARPVDGSWPSRYHIRQVEEPELAPFRRLVVEEDPDAPFGARSLNIRRAIRRILYTDHDTLVQFFPDWVETGKFPVRVYRRFWSWTPPDMQSLSDVLPEELREKLDWWHSFPAPDEDAPMSTAGLCRRRRKDTPVWYAYPGTALRTGEVGMTFLAQWYSTRN